MSDSKNNKKSSSASTDPIEQKYDKSTKDLIVKTVADLLKRLDADLAENIVFAALKLDGVHFADIIDATNETQKRRNLIMLMNTTEDDNVYYASWDDFQYYGYKL